MDITGRIRSCSWAKSFENHSKKSFDFNNSNAHSVRASQAESLVKVQDFFVQVKSVCIDWTRLDFRLDYKICIKWKDVAEFERKELVKKRIHGELKNASSENVISTLIL